MTSPDAINWTIRSASPFDTWHGVTYANGLFVAVGGGIKTSPDGITWTNRTLPAIAVWLSVTYGNGLFVAVSFNVASYSVMTSPDGITWTAHVLQLMDQPGIVLRWYWFIRSGIKSERNNDKPRWHYMDR